MKDHIQNFSLPRCTLSKRLFVVTGKGGTGKTTIALSISYALKQLGKKVLYYQSMPDSAQSLALSLDIPTLDLELYQSTEEYIARKLGQKTIANWILKTPFFKSLLDILPSLGDMILLGHLLDKLQQDPELTIVMDAPSTGHTLSFFESPHNFKSIFKTGLLAKDIDQMFNFLNNPESLFFVIVSLPTAMAVQESKELETQLKDLNFDGLDLFINNYLYANKELLKYQNSLPEFLNKKINLENEAVAALSPKIKIPFFIKGSPEEIIQESFPYLNGWEAN